MSRLQRGDEHLHHADGSHRWSGGPADVRGREAYLASLRDHVDQHRAGFVPSGRPRPDRPRQVAQRTRNNMNPALHQTQNRSAANQGDGNHAARRAGSPTAERPS